MDNVVHLGCRGWKLRKLWSWDDVQLTKVDSFLVGAEMNSLTWNVPAPWFITETWFCRKKNAFLPHNSLSVAVRMA